ncbi:MAG: phosphate acyltransferase, partial [Pseudomonadota bacterium]|nr:phosphate acyltransferase [Pseudomonadota bacterium]
MNTTLAVDAMGGDYGIPVTVPAAWSMVLANPDLSIKLVGAVDSIENALGPKKSHPRLEIIKSTEVVEMDESAVSALKNKKNSSLRLSIDLVKAGKADACVSAGNTGALMATARFVLKTLPGIDRPAIVSALPRANGHVHILDLGANVESLPEHLLQFGMMGASLVRTLENNPNPTVGLLNIGSEEVKGN